MLTVCSWYIGPCLNLQQCMAVCSFYCSDPYLHWSVLILVLNCFLQYFCALCICVCYVLIRRSIYTEMSVVDSCQCCVNGYLPSTSRTMMLHFTTSSTRSWSLKWYVGTDNLCWSS